MHVEVNEQNIVLYGLVQLTGNSAEELLQAAAEATESGYILSCDVPDIAEDLIELNVFESAGSEPADRSVKHDGGNDPFGDGETVTMFDGAGRVIDVHFSEETDVVTGEVLDSYTEEG